MPHSNGISSLSDHTCVPPQAACVGGMKHTARVEPAPSPSHRFAVGGAGGRLRPSESIAWAGRA